MMRELINHDMMREVYESHLLSVQDKEYLFSFPIIDVALQFSSLNE